MQPKKVVEYLCPSCDEPCKTRKDAMDCCSPDELEKVDSWMCSECEETYEDRDEAKDCCKDD